MDSAAAFTCTICGKVCKGQMGLSVHRTKKHAGQSSQPPTALPLDPAPPAPPPTDNTSQSVQQVSNLDKMRDFLVFIQTVRAHNAVIKRIPKAARIQIAMEWSTLINATLQKDAPLLTWVHLFTFSYIALQSPDRKNKLTKDLSMATIVKRNLEYWLKLKPLPLDTFKQTILSKLQRRRKSKTANDAEAIRLKLVQAKLCEGDITGAIRILSSTDSIAAANMETYQKLLEKHPTSVIPIDVEEQPALDIQPVSVTETMKAIMGFAAGSSGGMDGIRPQHMKGIVGKETGDHGVKFLESLSSFGDFCLGGSVPDYVTHFLYGATLCGLNKKDNSIRPIAVGNTIRRLVARIGSSRIADQTGEQLRPKQLGFGTRGGAETGVHAARHFVNYRHQSTKIFVKLDYKNAYNEMERQPMLRAVKAKCPDIYLFMKQCYGLPTWLSFGDFTMLSQRGCQQGDPCGPAAFCIGIHDMVNCLESEFNIWYIDDGTIGGEPDVVINDLETVIAKSSEIGLELNFGKCEIKIQGNVSPEERAHILQKINQVAPGIVDRQDDIELLGSPLTLSGIRSAISKKLHKLKIMVGRMDKLNAHHSYCLLRSSLSIPQLSYLLRTTPCWNAMDELEEYDRVLKDAMESIVNCRFTGNAWSEATLPVKLGGLGLRNATNLCYSSFLGSIHSVAGMVRNIVPSFTLEADPSTLEALDAWSSLALQDIPAVSDQKFQRVWDLALCTKLQRDISEHSTSLTSKARLLANNNKEAGAWLNAFPFASLGTLLDNQSFRIAVSLRLGLPLCVPHTCICGKEVDELGIHGLCCKNSAGRWARHAIANDLLKRTLVTSKIPALLEPTGCNRSDGKKPDGLTLVPWKNGKPLVWDFTCADTLAPSYVKGNSRKAGFAAQTREAYKLWLYRNLAPTYHVVPICIETLGTIGESGLKLIRRIGELLQNVTGEKRSTSFLIQRLSIAIQRGNAAAVLGTIPSDTNLEEIYYL